MRDQNHAHALLVPCFVALIALTSAAKAQSAAENGANATIASAPQAALPANLSAPQIENWRNEIGTFKIALVRGWSTDMSRPALARVEATFAKALGTPVKVVVFERFTSLIDAQADGRIDFAAYSARAFAAARLMCECVDALAAPASASGETGQITVLAGDVTQIPTLAKLGSAKLGRVMTAAITTSDMLRGNLVINGKSVTSDEAYWVDFPDYSALSTAYQTKQIDGFVAPIASTSLSAANADEGAFFQWFAGTGTLRRTKIVWRSEFWAYGPIAVRNNLPIEAKTLLLQTLEQLDMTDPVVHATLSENLTGPYRKTDIAAYANASASIMQMISQNAKWR